VGNGRKAPDSTPGPLGHNDAHDPSLHQSKVLPMEGQLFAKPPKPKQRQAAPPPLKHDPSSIQLDYWTRTDDQLPNTNKKTTFPVGGSPILAIDGINYFLHGNNRIEVWADEEQTTSAKGIAETNMYRVWRVWSADLDPKSRMRISDYMTGSNNAFVNDGSGGNLWIDVPGVTVSKHRSERRYRRHLVEFLVGVIDRPDAGGLYFQAIIDETPDEYRVTMTGAQKFTEDQWKGFFPLGYELGDVVTKTGPETRPPFVAAPASKPVALEDDLGVSETYGGWHKFPPEHGAKK
jgi:hypothetical protein